MRKFFTKRNIIIAVVVLAVVGLWWNGKQTAAKKIASTERVVTAERGDVVSSLTSSGQILAGTQAVLTFPAPGKLSYVGIGEGDSVKKGRILVSLDLGDLQTAWNRAYYQYVAADANAKQIEDEVKGHDSDESFAQKTARVAAQTARDTAYDTMLAAQRAVRNAQLTAPFNGIVTAVTATAVGDTVGVTDGVSMVDPDSLYFSAEVDESDVGKVTTGLPVKVSLDAFEGQKFDGVINEIGFVSRLSSTGATVYPVKIKLLVDGVMKTLRVGMNGDAEMVLATQNNVLTLPVEAVVDGEVTVQAADKTEKKIKVETGLMGITTVEIKSGLTEGEKVVIK